MSRLVMILALASIGLLAACSTAGGTGGTLDGTGWTLKTYAVGGTATPLPAGMVIDAKFAGGTVAGFAGCNLYTAPATVSGATLKVGQAATTMKACAPAVNVIETAYLASLASVGTFTATADTLTLFDGSGKQVLVYGAAAANPLQGEWIVTGYNNGADAVTSPITGTELTVAFTPDGQAYGSAGCNNFTGGYTLNGTSLTVGPLAATMKACEEAISTQEAAFLTALQTPTTVETSGGTVTLRDAAGATQVVLSPK